MNDGPEMDEVELERRISRVLRAQPLRRAPSTLQQRVLNSLRAVPPLPWWRRSLLQWPRLAQVSFALTAAGAAFLCTQLMGWCSTRLDANPLATFIQMIGHSVPTTWWYVAGAFVAMLYAAGIGLGALAWRTLFTSR